MADDVKWIRFKVGTFDGMSFKRVKKAKIDGVVNLRDKLTAVWFELLDLGGKVNNQGFLVNDELAFKSFDDIAIVLDRTPEEIEMCIKWFVNEKMMEITNDIFMISNWSKYQNIDGLEKIQLQNRERQARFKERKKQLALEYKDNVTDNVVVTHGNGVSLIDNTSNSNSNSSSTSSKKIKESKQDYFLDERLNAKFEDYLNMRVSIKKKATTQAIKLAVSKLQELGNNDVETMIQILEQSILNSWQGLFPLKQDPKKVTKTINDRW